MARQTKLHILVYLDQGATLSLFARSGILQREMAVYRRLVEAGHTVTVLSWGKGEDDPYRETVAPIRVIQNRTQLPNRVWMLYRLLRIRSEFGSDAIVITNQLGGAYLVAFASVVTRIDLVLRFGYLRSLNLAATTGKYSLRTTCARLNEVVAMLAAKSIIVTTDSIRDIVARQVVFARRKITVIPNYVDTVAFSAIAPNDCQDAVHKPITVVCTARLSQEKGCDLLIKAMAHRPDDELLLIGDGPEKNRLEALAYRTGARVRFLGIVNNEALPAIYRKCDVFALFSAFEGHPKALIEAMACGLAIIAAPVCGVRDVVQDGVTGLLVDRAPRSIAAALERLAEDPILAARLGHSAAVEASARYGLDRYLRSIEAVIKAAEKSGP